MPIKLSVQTYGKKDVFGFDPRDLVKNFAAFTGRKERTEESIEAMVLSLLAEGQEQPFTYRKGFKGAPVPITGHTRILAAARITERRLKGTAGGQIEIQYGPKNPFIVHGMLRQCNDLEALLHTFRENDDETRTPPTPIDHANLIRVLGETHGLKDAEIAEKLRKPASWVSKHRRLLDLDTVTQQQTSQGDLKFDAALAATSVEPKRRQEVIQRAKDDGDGKVTAAGIKKAARDLKVETVGKTATARTDAEWKTWLRIQATGAAFHGDGRLVNVYRGILAWREGTLDDIELRDRFAVLEAGPKKEPVRWDGDNRGHGLLVSALRLREQGAEYADLQEYVAILNRVRCSPALSLAEVREIAAKAVRAPAGQFANTALNSPR